MRGIQDKIISNIFISGTGNKRCSVLGLYTDDPVPGTEDPVP